MMIMIGNDHHNREREREKNICEKVEKQNQDQQHHLDQKYQVNDQRHHLHHHQQRNIIWRS